MKQLIDKYFEGETTLDEEQKLRDYFQQEDVEESLKQYRAYFGFFDKIQNSALDDTFELKLQNQVAINAKVVKLKTWRRRLGKFAAMAVFMVAAWMIYQNLGQSKSQTIDWEKYETKDPELALEQTKAALMLISSKLNEGTQKAGEGISKAGQIGKYMQ